MKKTEHLRILAGIVFITALLSINGLIQGFDILIFALLGIVGLYFSFFFIRYVYAQRGYSLGPEDSDI